VLCLKWQQAYHLIKHQWHLTAIYHWFPIHFDVGFIWFSELPKNFLKLIICRYLGHFDCIKCNHTL
jgi:hypothetical protein